MARRAAGFTLVEVVVALAVLGLLVSLTYGALGLVTRVYDAAEVEAARAERVRIVSDFLTRTVTSAQPIAIAQARGFEVQFEGSAEELRFIAELPPYVGTGGFHELLITVGENDAREGLWLARRVLTMEPRRARLTGEFHWRLLAGGVSVMRVRYFGRRDDDEPAAWHDEWRAAKRLPRLVELTLDDADGTRWPVLRARPRAQVLRYISRPGRGREEDGGNGNPNQVEEPRSQDADPSQPSHERTTRG